MPLSMSDTIAKMSQAFAQQLPGRVADIQKQIAALTNGPPNSVQLETLHRAAHSLAGAAGTFGMPSVGEAARTLERALDTLSREVPLPAQPQFVAAQEALAHLQVVVETRLASDGSELPAFVSSLDHAAPSLSPLVFIVEDDLEQATNLRELLLEQGYRVERFERLDDFRTALRGDARPAAIIMDMIFPDGDDAGAQTITELKTQHLGCPPVLFASIRDDIGARLAAYRAGASAYLAKPIDAGKLLRMLDELTCRIPAKPYEVVLIDDDTLTLDMHAQFLRRVGMIVRTESDPLRAFDLLLASRPDVLVLDVYMPGCSGPELAAVLREHDNFTHLPILYLSGETDMSKQLLALNVGGDDFLVKPVLPNHLVSAVLTRARRSRHNIEMMETLQLTLYEREREHLAVDRHAIVSVANAAGDITYANDKFTQISGYSRSELLGHNHRILKSGEHTVDFYNSLWQAISEGHVWQGEICNRRKDGSVYWVNSTIVPFLDREGVPYQYVSVRTDVTHIKEAALALVAAKNAADKANQAKSKFLSNMSHELRTPMNAILGFAQLMEVDQNLPTEHRDGAAEIMKAGEHLLALIGGILDLAKIEAGRIELRIQALSYRTWVADCMGLVKPIADKQQITLHWDKDLDVIVLADHVRLRQILLNLLSNAIKYNRIGGNVWLTAQMVASDRVRVTIADSGPGIAPDRLSELFQPFRRLGAEGGASEGTGLGLAITRNLVEMMNGKIGVSTELGRGSAFWLDLPTLESNRGEGSARFAPE